MKVLYASTESMPFIRTGGLGDVTGALPEAIGALGADVRVILPLYDAIPATFRHTMKFLGSSYVDLAWRRQYLGVFESSYNGTTFYFIDNEYYFGRKGLYGHFDDGERFAFYSKAVLEAASITGFYPDVLHVNDWQTSLVPLFLDVFYRGTEGYKNTKTVLTIHNIEFQGQFDKYVIPDILGIPADWNSVVDWGGCANYLKAGIERANVVTTVSETYAGELANPFYSFGLDPILKERAFKLKGVVNGIDVKLYDSNKDKLLFETYGLKNLAKKKENKKALCEMLDLPYDDKRPMIGMVTRLTEQKGLDLIAPVLDDILAADVQLVVLGQGDWKYETLLKNAEAGYKNKVRIMINFSLDLAQKIYGASDMFLMPSKFEPCGLGQMIAMRYASVPIVRETGGLKDTVIPYNAVTGEGTGFTFKTYNPYDMLDAVWRALGVFQSDRKGWETIQRNCLKSDFSWKKSAQKYLQIYKNL